MQPLYGMCLVFFRGLAAQFCVICVLAVLFNFNAFLSMPAVKAIWLRPLNADWSDIVGVGAALAFAICLLLNCMGGWCISILLLAGVGLMISLRHCVVAFARSSHHARW